MDEAMRKWHRDQLHEFNELETANYETLGRVLEGILKEAAKAYAPMAAVSWRVKSLESFAEKIIRKHHKYPDPVHQLTDLCGARVVVHTQAEVKRLCAFIEQNPVFDIDEANSEDVGSRLRTSEFGYRAIHYIVTLRPGDFQVRPEEPSDLSVPSSIKGRKAEIQVCTLLEHTWAAIGHDRLYKTSVKVPEKLKRDVIAVAALFENADQEFARATEALDTYISDFDAYLTPETIRDEVDKWKNVLEEDPANKKAARKIADLVMPVEDWDTAIEVLSRPEVPKGSTVLRVLGRAKCRKGAEETSKAKKKALVGEGRADLEAAIRANVSNINARCDLGDSWLEEDRAAALKHYEGAFNINPADPRTLSSYLECKILVDQRADFLPLMRGSLEAAAAECRKRADLGVYLPEAYYDMGKFTLFLGRPYESLNMYAKAVHLTNSSTRPIVAGLRSAESMSEAVGESGIKGLEWVRRFLTLCVAGRLMVLHRDAQRATEGREVDVRKARDDLSALEKAPGAAEKEVKEAADTVASAEKALVEARAAEASAKKDADGAVPELLSRIHGEDLDGEMGESLVIVAGGCDVSVDEKLKEAYSALLREAFTGFAGTIISGGTKAGVSGIVGDLENRDGAIRKIAYLPSEEVVRKAGDEEHSGYERTIRTDGEEYSPLGPIRTWADLLVTGLKPWEVRVVGINGGQLSAFEYRLGLALGALVGILESSGREASKLLPDADWWDVGNLLRLPQDAMTLRAFVNPGTSTLSPDRLVEAGKAIHADYVEGNRGNPKKMSPSMMPWENLRPDYRESNIQQAAYAEEILRACGFDVEPLKAGETIQFPEYERHVECMARMEHGRWNAERLVAGWRYDREANSEKKTSPYLVPWDKLPLNVREYDLKAVRNFPKVLAKAQLKIVPLETPGASHRDGRTKGGSGTKRGGK